MPISARLPMVRHEEVNGRGFDSPPIFRMSCSSPRL